MMSKMSGARVVFKIRREDKILSFDVNLSKCGKTSPIDLKINDLLRKNKRICLIIIVDSITSSGIGEIGFDEVAFRNEFLNESYNHYLSYLSETDNFSIVDRNMTDQILREFAFDLTGLVSDKLRAKIGEVSGATYILNINVAYWKGFIDSLVTIQRTTNRSLIEIESGNILAVDYVRDWYR